METLRGLLKPDGQFVSMQSARDDELVEGVYTASYVKPTDSIESMIQAAVRTLPEGCTIFSSGSLLDRSVVDRIPIAQRAQVIQIEANTIDFEELKSWVRENRNRYFLNDPCFAAILFRAVSLVEKSRDVAIIGPVPQVHDLSWSFSSECPNGRRLFTDSQWALVETSKSGSMARACALHKKIHSILDAQTMLGFLREINFRSNEKNWQTMGFKIVGGGSIARHINLGQLYREGTGSLPLTGEQIKNLWPFLLKRSVKSNRCYNRIESYVD